MSRTISDHFDDELIETVGTDVHFEKLPPLVCMGIIVGISASLWAGIYFAVTSLIG